MSFGMNIERSWNGIGQGALEGWSWSVPLGLTGELVAPVAVVGDTIAATATSLRDGSARAVLVSGDAVTIELETGTYVAAGAPGTYVVGMVGFGKGGFRLTIEGGRHILPLPAGAESMDIDCVNGSGMVGGSAEIRGIECAAVWYPDGVDVMPEFKRVTAIGESGAIMAISRNGHPAHVAKGSTFATPGCAISVNGVGDALVNAGGSISVWRESGGIEAVPIRGYDRATAIGWSASGTILGFGVAKTGLVQHWLYDPRLGLTVLSGQEIHPGLTIKEVSAIGSSGTLAGTAVTQTGRFLVRLDPPTP